MEEVMVASRATGALDATLVFVDVIAILVGFALLPPQPTSVPIITDPIPTTISTVSAVKRRRRRGEIRRKSPARLRVPETPIAKRDLSEADVLARDVPGAVVVRVSEPDAPGCTVAELQETPTGSVPQLRLMELVKPRMLWVSTAIVAVWPAATVSGLGVAVALKSGFVT